MDKFTYDMFYEIEKPTVILSTVYHKHYGVLENIDFDSFSCNFNMNSAQEISFDVYKYVDEHECSLWDKLISFRYVYIPQHHEYYKIDVTLDVDDKTVKHITGTSAGEYELSQRKIQNLDINTPADITYYEVWDEDLQKYREVDTNQEKTEGTIFYNEDNTDKSMLHRVLKDRAPDWSIAHVDDSLKGIMREFSVSNQSVYDCFTSTFANELDCLFKFNSVDRTISVYDLLNQCEDCGYRGEFTDECPKCQSTNIQRGYGDDSHIYISANNYANKITVDGDEGSVKNCFRVSGGDDLMTATVVNCNPAGSEYIYKFSAADYADMPEDLVNRLIQYYADYDDAEDSYQTSVKNYYNALTSYYYYKTSMMPRLDNDHWEPEHSYELGEKCYVITLPSWCYLECKEIIGNGKTGSVEFDATNVKEGDLINDMYDANNGVVWEVVKHIVSVPPAEQVLTDIKSFVQSTTTYYEDKFPSAITTINRYVKTLITSAINPLFKIDILDDEYNTWTTTSDTEGTLVFNLRVTNTTDTEDTAVTTVVNNDEWSWQPLSMTCKIASSREDHEKYMLQLVKKQIDRDDTTFTGLWEIEYLESEDDVSFIGSETEVTVLFDTDGVIDYVKVDITFSSLPTLGVIASSIYDVTEGTDHSVWSWNTENPIFKDDATRILIRTLYPDFPFDESIEMPFNDPDSIGIVGIDNEHSKFTFRVGASAMESFSGHYVARSDEDFRRALKQYSLDMLDGFAKSYGGCIDTLLTNGISSGSEKNYFHGVDLYNEIYTPYNVRLGLIDEEIARREETVKYYYNDPNYKTPGDTIPVGGALEYDPSYPIGQVQIYLGEMKEVQKQLDLKEYLKDEEAQDSYWMWHLLYNYLRDGEYQNSNYISEGLSNNELVNYANELLDKARLELNKASELQYTLSDDLHNLLNTEEFAPFKNKFKLGDYIICGVGDVKDNLDLDDHNYKLRLITLSYSYSNPESISVTFANVTKITNYFSDVQDVLSQAKSMSSSYPLVTHQVEKNTETTNQVSDWNTDGLNSSLTRIKNNNQEEVSYSEEGILVRGYDYDYDEDKDNRVYGDEQLRLTHNILAFTDDNWKTATLGLGKQDYTYYNVEGVKTTGTGYGLIAKFVDAGYIRGSQFIGGELYSDATYTDNGVTKPVSHMNWDEGTFELARGNLRYYKDGQNYKLEVNGDLIVKDSNGRILLNADTDNHAVTIGTWNVKNESIQGNPKSSIYSGISSVFDDTTTGTYVGTDGIRNQGDNSKYTQITQGKLTTNDVAVTGGSINMGNNTFSVNNSGSVICQDITVYDTIKVRHSMKNLTYNFVDHYYAAEDWGTMINGEKGNAIRLIGYSASELMDYTGFLVGKWGAQDFCGTVNYESGEYYFINNWHSGATITDGRKQVIFMIPLPKNADGLSVSISSVKANIRQSGNYIYGSSSGRASISDVTASITNGGYAVMVTLKNSNGFTNATNNDAVAVDIEGLLTFT